MALKLLADKKNNKKNINKKMKEQSLETINIATKKR